MNQDQDVSAGVSAAHSYVVKAAVVTQRELAVAVDAVVADAVGAGVQWGAGWGCFGSGEVGLLGGATAERAVRAHGVVVGAEGVELGL